MGQGDQRGGSSTISKQMPLTGHRNLDVVPREGRGKENINQRKIRQKKMFKNKTKKKLIQWQILFLCGVPELLDIRNEAIEFSRKREEGNK